jgi:Gpi18-like mannosyltransferase
MLSGIGITAARWCFERGYTLDYNDAEAHLDIARRILDSRTPGPEQLGAVRLPLPHVLMIPLVMRAGVEAGSNEVTNVAWWRSGLAGVIPSCIAFILAGTFLFAAARRAYASTSAAFAVAFIFALNPNMLYLQSTPMTEALFAAALAATVWAVVWFRDSQSALAIVAAAIASNAASLTRYEGWFVIPFIALCLLLAAKRKWHAALFAALAALGPLAWLAHNQYYYGNALEFYNGPLSAMAIYRHQLARGMQPYPGDHDWRASLRYYFAAAKLVVGLPLISGAGGVILMFFNRGTWTRVLAPVLILALPPAFYIWSMHSSGTPVFVPALWPFGWYNTRYAIAMLPLAAFATGAMVTIVPKRARVYLALFVLAMPAAGWWIVMNVKHQPAICWKEAEVNSAARLTWTAEAAAFLAANYRPGSGIIHPFGDLTGVLREAGIPLRESIHEGNTPEWTLAVSRPYPALRAEWALAFSGDEVSTAVLRAHRYGKNYELRKQIIVKGAPIVEIWQLR